ncbi:MAG: hypothetical protein AB7K24_20775 [Gemmataceae bacterium]
MTRLQPSRTTTEQAGRGPRLLFWFAVGLSLTLIGLVLLAPRLGIDSPFVRLFAQDQSVRRSAVAAALGLLVTAFVFFRGNSDGPSQRSSPRKPPPGAIGA